MSEINTNLIRTYVTEGRTDALISLFETLISDRNRAELQTRAYLHEIKLLSERFHSMTKDITRPVARQRSETALGEASVSAREDVTKPRVTSSHPKSPSKRHANAVDIEL